MLKYNDSYRERDGRITKQKDMDLSRGSHGGKILIALSCNGGLPDLTSQLFHLERKTLCQPV